jgi:RNA 2',3'-cyclic 3'-phosphodiesterase
MKSNYFFALTLPDETKEYIYHITEQLKPVFPFKKWLHQEDYHITLAFLGHAEEEMKLRAMDLVKDALYGHEGFNLTLYGIGTFGSKGLPRILWIDTEQSKNLIEVQKQTYRSCMEAGFTLDKKPFKPHITIARKYVGEQEFQPSHLQELSGHLSSGHTFFAEKVTLYKTHMGASPSYEPIFTVPLRNS